LIRKGVATNAVTEPVSALIAACRALKITRIGLISPYIAQVSDKLVRVLADADIHVTTFASFNEAEEHQVVRIAPESIAHAATEMAQNSDCEAVFLSCTNLRTLDVIDDVEAATGLPVLSSNQVLAWDMLRRADIKPAGFQPGKLWTV
jgi:maleate isomerase